jgi:ribosome-associated protein
VERTVPIRGETIRLGQLIKLIGIVDAGGDAKAFLAGHRVRVNGEPESRRGRRLRVGDAVELGDEVVRLTPAERGDA